MAQITSEQLSEWEVYNRLEPIGDVRIEYSIAQLCSLVLNIAKSAWSKDKKRSTPIDFMPDWGGFEKKKEDDQMVADTPEKIKRLFTSLAGIMNPKKKDKK